MNQYDKRYFAHTIAVYFCCIIEFNKLVVNHVLLFFFVMFVIFIE